MLGGNNRAASLIGRSLITLCVTFCAALAHAQGVVTESYMQGLIPMAPDAIGTLGADLFGDKVNLYNGALSFEQTDISLPGNSKLPVALMRRTTPGKHEMIRGQFGDWDTALPSMSGTFPSDGWVNSDRTTTRCSVGTAPPPLPNGDTLFWQGVYLNVPGAGNQELLRRANYPTAPTDGNTYPYVTHTNWQIRCLSSIQNGAGEGYVAISPEGIRYRFDWMARRATVAAKGAVYEHFLFATEVSDRFGNWVRYTFDPSNPMLLTRIESNDGRVVTVNNSSGLARSAYDGTRTFLYGYGGSVNDLTSVTQPDGSSWTFNLGTMRTPNFIIQGESANCDNPGSYDPDQRSGTITHPSGAQGTFTIAFAGHGKTFVQRQCKWTITPTNTTGAVWQRRSMSLTLLGKSIAGPGLPTLNWSYTYGSSACWISGPNQCTASTSDRKTVTVTKPDGAVDRHIFGNRWRVNEGQLLQLEEGWDGTAALRTTTYRYRQPSGQSYPEQFGTTPLVTNDWLASRHRPLDQKVITQQGVTFTWELAANGQGLDALVRPLKASMSSSLGYSKSETKAYSDNYPNWVMGQVASVTTNDGKVPSSTTYNATTALPSAYYEFGRLLQTYQYNANGTLYRVFDPLSRYTTWTNYKRGQAQSITYRDGTGESAVINNLGKPDNHTNAAGTTTGFGYDVMGRLAQISPPAEASMSYHPMQSAFERVPSVEYGLGVGHWRQTVSKGSARTVRYYDALWRPRLVVTYDDNVANTTSIVEYRYDADGRKTFESYPQSSLSGVDTSVAGKSWVFDALGREKTRNENSEIGTLTTTTEYLSGFTRRVTNPRNHATTFSYQVFDEPREERILGVSSPETVWLQISRDIHGAPSAITRGGTFGGGTQQATRSYVYDVYHRLCKTIEPETGATVQAYDSAGNIAWRASGLSLPGSGCDQASVPEARKVSFHYDARDRLDGTTFGDGSPGIGRSYTADGKPYQVWSDNITWTYRYNNHRLLYEEEQANGGTGFKLTYGINSSGDVASTKYPDGATVSYSPNALGQPTQVSGYASGVTYHPNGRVAGYTLANGVSFGTTLNTRGLPRLWEFVGVVRDLYSYDANGNVTAIADQQETVTTRSMAYDGLDRLTQANGIWGSGQFRYDALDNLVYSQVGARTLSHNIDAGTNRLASISGSLNFSLGYDLNGNVAAKGAQTYAFDIGNRLRTATGKASYTYDGLGRRAIVSYADGSWRKQVYSQSGKLMFGQHSSQGNTRHVYLGDQLIAETSVQSGTIFAHTDALGSPIARTGASGQLVDRTRYEAYGRTAAGMDPSGIGYTGHVSDVDTGLIYMQQRYYEPIAARFLSVDPILTETKTGEHFNRYVYAKGNPYKFKDPDGQAAQIVFGAVVGGISGFVGGMNSGAQGWDLARATLAGVAVGAVTAAIPIGGTALAAFARNAIAAGSANAVGQRAGGAESVSVTQVAVQAAIGGAGAVVGNAVGGAMGIGLASAESQGIGTTAAVAAGAIANAFVSTENGGMARSGPAAQSAPLKATSEQVEKGKQKEL